MPLRLYVFAKFEYDLCLQINRFNEEDPLLLVYIIYVYIILLKVAEIYCMYRWLI